MNLKSYIKEIEDFPKTGILFRDIQPLLADNTAYNYAVRNMLFQCKHIPDYFLGIESRGFIFAASMAMISGAGFKMIRKAGKLPPNNLQTVEYDLEYGSAVIQLEKKVTDNVNDSRTAVVVDDVYATGGTMEAARKLALKCGYSLYDNICLLDIGLTKPKDTKCLISY